MATLTLPEVVELAREAHRGQVDKAGRDYFDGHLRPIAESLAVFGPDAVELGWVHDIVEDTGMSLTALREAGVRESIVTAVDSVTRREGEPYLEFIGRSCNDEHGRQGKLADNAWNLILNPDLAAVDPTRAASLLRGRYVPARVQLLAANGLREDSTQVLQMQAVLYRHRERLRR
ncbi:Guanosine polyphosphate pyrophosphohydrolases/synthetases (plasmid) [Tsukamurella tyrosinosolvens]|uniref:HD domain-containing protein n=1 Tax=Tsukamurella tyrosinosolvens TaxID=57704 RepID=A0A1H4ULL1_TSUTY|nr:hypothetical protein [Tsukamurella tyrosinosolvens]KXO99060.1 hypothetical protein AXK58_24205 [Tsukamurella tyrosinosolvens]SEC69575.1 hypothetical protein SAMN04489793_2944 [Tsukamurella tyrosinosolvens]VEH94332.1 Guanosine polyphosphate pyrophosphohydrolases/synthetases [Tsukamurella tyrosinosolvens]